MNEAELLFTQILDCDRMSLYLDKDKYLPKNKLGAISQSLKRRLRGEPIQYILGKAEFMGLELKIDKNVLIPRPETEILVETTIEYATRLKVRRILDLGTGSGCIAVTLAKCLAHLEIDATDISDKALAVAKENEVINGVSINFIQSDLFDKLNNKEYDIIVSNPPYIVTGQIRKLQLELQYEPRLALDGGYDGLRIYHRIIRDAASHLKNGGLLIMEIGFNQRSALEGIFNGSGSLEVTKVIKDYGNIDRVVVARKVDENG